MSTTKPKGNHFPPELFVQLYRDEPTDEPMYSCSATEAKALADNVGESAPRPGRRVAIYRLVGIAELTAKTTISRKMLEGTGLLHGD